MGVANNLQYNLRLYCPKYHVVEHDGSEQEVVLLSDFLNKVIVEDLDLPSINAFELEQQLAQTGALSIH